VTKTRAEYIGEQNAEGLRLAPTRGLENLMKTQCRSQRGERFTVARRYALYKNLSQKEGEGADGTVWFATDTKENKEVFVKLFQSRVDQNDTLRMRANREWAMVKKIKSMRLAPADATATHPIVALCEVAYGSIEQGHEEMGMCCIQVMERCDGDLFSILSCRQAPLGMRFSEPLARWLFRQILRGVKLMADNGVYHRDLKVENILIKNDIHVKLADFGTGTDLQRTKTATDIGTLSNNPFWDPMRGGTDGYDAEKWDVFQCESFCSICLLWIF